MFFLFCKSFISGITLLGLPTEIYSFGIQYLYVIGGVIIMGFVMGFIYLPVFHNLNITSTYEVSCMGMRTTDRSINYIYISSNLINKSVHQFTLIILCNLHILNETFPHDINLV